MAVVGVDFGCLNAVLAQAERGGVKVLLNENSKRLNANMVSIQGKQRFLGEAAVSIARSNYKNTMSCLKRFIGRRFDEPELQAEMARLPGVTFVAMEDGCVGIEVAYDDQRLKLSIPQIAGMMLFKLSQICAASNKNVGIADVVVSVPAWFNNAQRLATLDACEIAGVKCLRLMHDTTATALEYGIWRSAQKMFDDKGQRVLFIDLGYSSYQVSVVEYTQGKLVVKATAFDRNLGGRDFDIAIAEFVAAEFAAKYPGENPLSSPKPKMKLLDACEKAKKTLSPHGVTEANLYIECLMNDRDFCIKLTLDKFEELVAPLLARLIPPIEEVLQASETEAANLQCVEIVGGASRVASVKRELANALGLTEGAPNYGLRTTLNADEAVAKGCAMQAAMLSPRFKVKEYVVVEAASYPVRLSWESYDAPAAAAASEGDEDEKGDEAVKSGETECVLFARNSETPKERRITFQKYSDFSLRASYADASGADVGEFLIKGVPRADGQTQQKVRVYVSHSLHGTVLVSNAQLIQQVEDDSPAAAAADADMDTSKDDSAAAVASEPKKKRKSKKIALAVEPVLQPSKMDRKALDAAIELEAQMANADRVITETNDMRNELEAYIYKMRDDVISVLRPFVSDADKATFETALSDAEAWLYEGDGYDTTKSNYWNRLASLKTSGDPLVFRMQEENARPAAVAALQSKIEELKTWANASDDAHITDEEKAKVRDEANKASDWLMDSLDKQSAKQQYEDPAFKVYDIKKKVDDIASFAKPIMTKPKPAPPKEPPKTAGEPPAKAPDVDMPDAPPAAETPAEKADDVEMPDAERKDTDPAV